MSRGLTTTEINALQNKVIPRAIFVKAKLPKGDLNLWSGLTNINTSEITGTAEDWTGSGTLLSISNITNTDSITAHGITVNLSGVGSGMYEYFISKAYKNRPLFIWFAIMNSDFDAVQYSYRCGKFYMDQLSSADRINENGEGVVDLSMKCESYMIDFQRATNGRYSQEDQKRLYPKDNIFRYVTSQANKEVPWNREIPKSGSTGGGNGGWLEDKRMTG